jgi:resuscitation-promoting factor RpfB
MPVKGGYLLIAGGGAIVLWSGIRGHKWSTVLRDIVSGKKLPTATDTALAIQTAPSAFQTGGTGTVAGTPSSTATGGTVAKNKAIAAVLATAYGWGPGTSNWKSLDSLWTQESGWDNHAKNPSSGAYGIPQSLPANKMGALANPPTSSAGAQITWGLKYIKTRWQTPNNAWGGYAARGNWY